MEELLLCLAIDDRSKLVDLLMGRLFLLFFFTDLLSGTTIFTDFECLNATLN